MLHTPSGRFSHDLRQAKAQAVSRNETGGGSDDKPERPADEGFVTTQLAMRFPRGQPFPLSLHRQRLDAAYLLLLRPL